MYRGDELVNCWKDYNVMSSSFLGLFKKTKNKRMAEENRLLRIHSFVLAAPIKTYLQNSTS